MMSMLYASEITPTNTLKSLRAFLVSLICIFGVVGLSATSAVSLSAADWGWPAEAVEGFNELSGVDGVKLGGRPSAFSPSSFSPSSLNALPFDLSSYLNLVSEVFPVLIPVFDLALSSLPRLATGPVFGAHSATSPPVRI